jgi:hypothetical protein
MKGRPPSSGPVRAGISAAAADPSILGPTSVVGREGRMESRLQALEEKVTRLTERLDQLEQRVPGASLPSLPQSWPLPGPDVGAPAGKVDGNRWVTFLGRSCLVLGGAFLIRALTDGGVLSAGPGVAFGVAFAATWLVLAHRATVAGAKLSATFHAVVGALIAYSLILEATIRLGAMSAPAAALTLAGFTGLVLAVAWRDRLGWLAWLGVVACGLVSVGLLRATGARAEVIGVLLALAAATFFGLGERWPPLRWVPAVLLDLVFLRGVFTSPPLPAMAFLALAVLSLLLALSRTVATRPLGTFEMTQAIAGLAISVGGGLRLAHDAGAGGGAVAGSMLAVSVLAAAFAGWVVPRRGDRGVDFLFYAALSLALLSSAVGLLTTGNLRGVLWAGFAVVAVLVGRRSHPLTLWSLAALLGLGAELSTGAVLGRVSPGGVIAFGLVVLAYVATVPRLHPAGSPSGDGVMLRVPAAALLLLSSVAGAELFVHAFRTLELDPARLAAARTIAAVVIAVVLALIRRTVERPDLSWIATLALVLGGIELAVVELPNGRPSTLLVCFVLYGAALILVPRLAPAGRDLLLLIRPTEPTTVTRS